MAKLQFAIEELDTMQILLNVEEAPANKIMSQISVSAEESIPLTMWIVFITTTIASTLTIMLKATISIITIMLNFSSFSN